MKREEEKGQESERREAGVDGTKYKITVLTIVISPPPRPLPWLIVDDNDWPHNDQDHDVARGPGE